MLLRGVGSIQLCERNFQKSLKARQGADAERKRLVACNQLLQGSKEKNGRELNQMGCSAKSSCQPSKVDACSSKVNKKEVEVVEKKQRGGSPPASLFCFLILCTSSLQAKRQAHCLIEHFSRFRNSWWLIQRRASGVCKGPSTSLMNYLPALFYIS